MVDRVTTPPSKAVRFGEHPSDQIASQGRPGPAPAADIRQPIDSRHAGPAYNDPARLDDAQPRWDEKRASSPWRYSRDSRYSNYSEDAYQHKSRLGNYELSDDQIDDWHVYRDLVGLSQPPTLTQNSDFRASYLWIFKTTPEQTKNLGVYQRLIEEELRAHIWYRSSTWASNILLLLQLCIAATLTSLGSTATSSFRTAITTLGAFNTVTAALLAYLKAKGLPGSALQYRDKLRKQKAEIDYMHRAFCVGTSGVSARMAADRAEDDFNKANNQFEASIATIQRQASGLALRSSGTWRNSTTRTAAAPIASAGPAVPSGREPPPPAAAAPEVVPSAAETV